MNAGYSLKCRLCGKNLFECGGYFERVNKGSPDEPLYECRPSCDAKLSSDEAVLAAVKGPNEQDS